MQLPAIVEEEGDTPDHSDDDDFQFLSDGTEIAGTTWKTLKAEAMEPGYTEKEWFKNLNSEGKKLLRDLRTE